MDKQTLTCLRFAAFDLLWIGFAFGLGDRSRNAVYSSEPIAIGLAQIVFVLVLMLLLVMLNPRWEGDR